MRFYYNIYYNKMSTYNVLKVYGLNIKTIDVTTVSISLVAEFAFETESTISKANFSHVLVSHDDTEENLVITVTPGDGKTTNETALKSSFDDIMAATITSLTTAAAATNNVSGVVYDLSDNWDGTFSDAFDMIIAGCMGAAVEDGNLNTTVSVASGDVDHTGLEWIAASAQWDAAIAAADTANLSIGDQFITDINNSAKAATDSDASGNSLIYNMLQQDRLSDNSTKHAFMNDVSTSPKPFSDFLVTGDSIQIVISLAGNTNDGQFDFNDLANNDTDGDGETRSITCNDVTVAHGTIHPDNSLANGDHLGSSFRINPFRFSLKIPIA